MCRLRAVRRVPGLGLFRALGYFSSFVPLFAEEVFGGRCGSESSRSQRAAPDGNPVWVLVFHQPSDPHGLLDARGTCVASCEEDHGVVLKGATREAHFAGPTQSHRVGADASEEQSTFQGPAE